jgi:hypothetical protein
MRRCLDELDHVGVDAVGDDAVGEDAANGAGVADEVGVIDGNPPSWGLAQLGVAQLGSAHSPAKITSQNCGEAAIGAWMLFEIGHRFGVARKMAGACTSETF